MRIQVLVTNDVYPPTFGLATRVFHLARALARRAEVRVTCSVRSRSRAAARETVDDVGIRRVRTYYATLFHYLERARLAPDYLVHAAFRAWPAPLLQAIDPDADVWQVESLALCGLLDRAPAGALRVYASQNVEAEWFERVGPAVWARGRWARYVEGLERRAVEAADLVLAVSEEDRDGFAARYGVPAGKLLVVENGFDGDRLRPGSPEERSRARAALGVGSERTLLFVGSDAWHNRVAVEHLFRELVPELERLEACLFLAGSVCGPFAARAARERRVRCLGVFSDLLPVLWAADVGLNPMTTGAGSNIKLPTYLAAGLPVVSTPFGARGFRRLAPFVHFAPVEEFARGAAQTRAHDPSTVSAALASYSWNALGDKLAVAYRERLASAGTGRAACAS